MSKQNKGGTAKKKTQTTHENKSVVFRRKEEKLYFL